MKQRPDKHESSGVCVGFSGSCCVIRATGDVLTATSPDDLQRSPRLASAMGRIKGIMLDGTAASTVALARDCPPK